MLEVGRRLLMSYPGPAGPQLAPCFSWGWFYTVTAKKHREDKEKEMIYCNL